jgi:hypothetical protein
MAVKKYKFSRTYVTFIVGGYLVAFLIALSSRPFPGVTNPFVLINLAFILFLWFGFAIGTYCIYDGERFCHVSSMMFNKCIPVGRINEVRIAPMLTITDDAKSLYIIGNVNGRERIIKMTEMAYTRKILVEVISQLKKANPSITLDESAEALLKKDASK